MTSSGNKFRDRHRSFKAKLNKFKSNIAGFGSPLIL